MTSSEKTIVEEIILSSDSAQKLMELGQALDTMYQLSQYSNYLILFLFLSFLSSIFKLRKAALLFQIFTSIVCILFDQIPIIFWGGWIMLIISSLAFIHELYKSFK